MYLYFVRNLRLHLISTANHCNTRDKDDSSFYWKGEIRPLLPTINYKTNPLQSNSFLNKYTNRYMQQYCCEWIVFFKFQDICQF